MEQINVVNIVFGVGIGLLWLLLAVKFLKNLLAPVRTVRAKVIDKHTIDSFSKYNGTGKSTRYVVVFQAEQKKLSFYVSGFSYGGYRKGESGMLKYKGDRIIDFH